MAWPPDYDWAMAPSSPLHWLVLWSGCGHNYALMIAAPQNSVGSLPLRMQGCMGAAASLPKVRIYTYLSASATTMWRHPSLSIDRSCLRKPCASKSVQAGQDVQAGRSLQSHARPTSALLFSCTLTRVFFGDRTDREREFIATGQLKALGRMCRRRGDRHFL